jgi:hypothetical protein
MDFPRFNFQLEILWIGSTMRGPGDMLGSMLDWAVMQTRGTTARPRHAGAQGHRCSPAVAREGEEDEAEPEAGSLEHERRRRGSTMAVEDSGGSSSV